MTRAQGAGPVSRRPSAVFTISASASGPEAAAQTAPEFSETFPFLAFNSALIALEGLDYLNAVTARLNRGAETPAIPLRPLVMHFETAVPTAALSWASTTGEALKRTGRATERLARRAKAWVAYLNTPTPQSEQSGDAPSEDTPVGEILEIPMHDLALIQASEALKAIDVALSEAAEMVNE